MTQSTVTAVRFLYGRLGLADVVGGGAGMFLFLYGALGAPSGNLGRPGLRLAGTPLASAVTSGATSSAIVLAVCRELG